ncbi:MAG: choice-of-anchor Q domain-containing protein [Gammaproteobacteria bacterium]
MNTLPITHTSPPLLRHPLAQAVALALTLGTVSVGAQAAIFNVTSNADSGAGSLRAAVAQANSAVGPDQITFDTGLGTITLSSGQIDITDTLTITGPAAGQTISGNNASRIFAVTDYYDLTLQNLTLSGGFTSADGYLPTSCAADTGQGSAVCALGNLTLTNTTIAGNHTEGENARGGALYTFGTIELTDSTVSGNSTAGDGAEGGGIHVRYGDATLTNSTLSGNSTTGNYARGGGLYTYYGTTTLTNCTVSGNSTAGSDAYGGGLAVSGSFILTNSTVSGNSTTGGDAYGGGIYAYGTVVLHNSTVTGNQASAGGGGIDIYDGTGLESSLSLSSTLLAGNSAAAGNLSLTGAVTVNVSFSLFGDPPGEITGTNSNNVFTDTTGLAALADNNCALPAGAPGSAACVQTHALQPGSAALDAGSNPQNLTTDQRGAGFPRVLAAAADIGAYEGVISTPPNTILLDTFE